MVIDLFITFYNGATFYIMNIYGIYFEKKKTERITQREGRTKKVTLHHWFTP